MTESPVLWLSDEQYSQLPLRERWLIAAASCEGCHEVGGNNRGPWVADVLHSVQLGEGYSWCAAFVTYCADIAGLDPEVIAPRRQLAEVATWERVALERLAITMKPKRGDLFFYVKPDRSGHIGFVVKPGRNVGDAVTTIEGNTDLGGSADGDGVKRGSRTVESLRIAAKFRGKYGFIDVDKLVAGR